MSEPIEDPTEEIKSSATGLFQGFKNLIREIFNVQDEVDKEGAAKTIRKDIVFKGFNMLVERVYDCF